VGFSLLMLMAAVLFVRTVRNLSGLDPGFETKNTVGFALAPELNGYSKQQSLALLRRLNDGLGRIPGMNSSALGMMRPLDGDTWTNGVGVEGYQPQAGEEMMASLNAVSTGYFRTIGLRLLSGRDFRDTDRPDGEAVAIVNQSFSRHYFGRLPAVGRYIDLNGASAANGKAQIIGVVSDAKYATMRDAIPRQVFIPYQQTRFLFGMNGYVRTSLPPEQSFAAIRRAVRELDPALPVFALRTLEAQRNKSLGQERLLAALALAFGLAAALLTAVGLYGLLAYSVSRRTRELGLRMALGAQSGSVIWLVAREVLLLWAIGTAAALPLALSMGRLIENQLYGVKPADIWTILAATLSLAIVAALAVAIPARRATRIQPLDALRYE